MAWRVGVDVGGTFTDLAAVDDTSGAVRLEKVPATPGDQSVGAAAGMIEALLGRHGIRPAAVTYLGQGTTVRINAVLERKGARTRLVTTQGMRDLLELRRQIRDDLYDLEADKPELCLRLQRGCGVWGQRQIASSRSNGRFRPQRYTRKSESSVRIRPVW